MFVACEYICGICVGMNMFRQELCHCVSLSPYFFETESFTKSHVSLFFFFSCLGGLIGKFQEFSCLPGPTHWYFRDIPFLFVRLFLFFYYWGEDSGLYACVESVAR